jgi:hypothetical protein
VVIEKLPPDLTALSGLWITTCTEGHFLRIAATWDGAWMWATKHCPKLRARAAAPDAQVGTETEED